MKQTSEMTKLNFITDHGSIRLSVRCALRAVLTVLPRVAGGTAAASAAIPVSPCAASEADDSAESVSSRASSAAVADSGPAVPLTASEPAAVSNVSVSGGSTSEVIAASAPLCSEPVSLGPTAADSRCAVSDIATLPLNSPYNSGIRGDRGQQHRTPRDECRL